MKQNIFFKLPAFLFVSALNVIPVFSADDSCLLDVQNINFTFKGLRSGSDGNIYMWEPSFVDPYNRKECFQGGEEEPKEDRGGKRKAIKKTEHSEKFDVMQEHIALCEATEQIRRQDKIMSGDVVTASLTLIFKKDERHYAITQKLTKRVEKKGGGQERKIIGFVSGTEGTEGKGEHFVDAKKYSLSDLLKCALERKDFLVTNPRVKAVVENIESIQQKKKEKFLQGVGDARDLLEIEERLQKFDALFPLQGGENSTLKKHGGYGPVADSEQFLLHYLEQELIQEDEDLKTSKGIYVDLMEEYTEKQYEYLKKNFSIHDYRIDHGTIRDKFERGITYSQAVQSFNPIGAILHLHSYYELCVFCGMSLAHEFYHKRGNFAERLKLNMRSGQSNSSEDSAPFFAVFASYTAMVSDSPHPLRPPGTISGKVVRNANDGETNGDGLLILERITAKKVLPLVSLG